MICGLVFVALCFVQTSLTCKDNANLPVDWWYMYKPPADAATFIDSSTFLYITSESVDVTRGWTASKKLMWGSMLQYTLAPLYSSATHDDYAIFIYDESLKTNVSAARGILMAGEDEGFWIVHTVPMLPDLTNPRAFPVKEFQNGHLIACFSLSLSYMNDVAALVRYSQPLLRYVSIPNNKKSLLGLWDFNSPMHLGSRLKALEMMTTRGTLDINSIVRSPGSKTCLYEAFAKNKNIYLDVYGQTDKPFLSSICAKNYSIRNIEGLSVKFLESVFYILEHKDYSRFSVSTASQWQKTGGSGHSRYWACFSNLDKEDKRPKGGIITCVNHYDVWRNFDNFKIKEPECYSIFFLPDYGEAKKEATYTLNVAMFMYQIKI